MVHLSSFRKVKAFGRTNFISSTGCPSEHPEQRNGENNTVNGAYSAILGGNGNNDGGLGFVGIFGNGLAAVSADTFHVSCLNAVNTPIYTGVPFPAGTIQRYALPAPALGLPAGTSILIIQ